MVKMVFSLSSQLLLNVVTSSSDACSRLRMSKARTGEGLPLFYLLLNNLCELVTEQGLFWLTAAGNTSELQPLFILLSLVYNRPAAHDAAGLAQPTTNRIPSRSFSNMQNQHQSEEQGDDHSPTGRRRRFPSPLGKRLTEKECMLLVGPGLGGELASVSISIFLSFCL